MKIYVKSAYQYNPWKYADVDRWEESDMDSYNSIDWKARDYEEYPVEDDRFTDRIFIYGLGPKPISEVVEFVKYLRSNTIYPPYYAPSEDSMQMIRSKYDVLGPMYGGRKHGKYNIHDRFETDEMYDRLSR